ncbi:MAG: cytochrome c, partial [Sinomicrobium sp.]|nr:cytochrome c [Sinomicrobium sp.]
MRKVIYYRSTFQMLTIGIALLLIFSTPLFAQEGDPVKGKTLFNSNCASCHNLDRKMTGPPLRGVGNKYEREWIYSWVANSSAVVKSGDKQAVAIFNEYK